MQLVEDDVNGRKDNSNLKKRDRASHRNIKNNISSIRGVFVSNQLMRLIIPSLPDQG